MEVDSLELLYILLAIIGLIVGLGLGVFVTKSRHEKEINGAQNSATGIIESAKKRSRNSKKKKHC